jgi:hypothetical protein
MYPYKGNCKICGKEFIACRPTQFLCSHKCSGIYQDGRPKKKGWHRPKFTKEHRKKLALANIGKKHTEETKKKISNAEMGEKSATWKGGRYPNADGYIIIIMHKHPFADNRGRYMEHRFVWEQHHGRYLTKEEQIHHINEIKHDNRLENLMLFPNNAAHRAFHNKKRKELIKAP